MSQSTVDMYVLDNIQQGMSSFFFALSPLMHANCGKSSQSCILRPARCTSLSMWVMPALYPKKAER